ncbi:hypothetical protein ACLKA7_007903 [Drosophila subpalustris]
MLMAIANVNSKTEKCDDDITKTSGGTAYWKFRGVRYTTSEDYLCWKENWELFLRECNTATGQWHPENVVCHEQEETNKYCPEELIEIHGGNDDPLCLHISSEPQKYNDEFCHGSNVVVPSSLSKDQKSNLVQFLLKRKIKEYWLPLRRENNTMPFKIRLPAQMLVLYGAQNIAFQRRFIRTTAKCFSGIRRPEDRWALYHVCVFKVVDYHICVNARATFYTVPIGKNLKVS